VHLEPRNPDEHWDSVLCAACAACAYSPSDGGFGTAQRGPEELRLQKVAEKPGDPLAYAYSETASRVGRHRAKACAYRISLPDAEICMNTGVSGPETPGCAHFVRNSGFRSRDQTRLAVFTFIEGFYDSRHRRTT
jgi:hypothetical protein